jgi:sterol desaturase/sphingolipid hydroxylase (fatty acid hydroxylase superfamily)
MSHAPPSSLESIAAWRAHASFVWMAGLLAWETAAPYFHQFDNWESRRNHGLRNLAMAVVNSIGVGMVFTGLWRAASAWAGTHGFGLLNLAPATWPGPVRVVAAVVLLDAWSYAWHRANHRIAWLWRFHRVHHSDPTMDVTTANRFHPGEIAVSSLLRVAVIPLLGVHFGELVLYETLLQFVVQLHHANVALPPWLERFAALFLVTPGMHKVHHSVERRETDSNFGSFGSCWDRVFGTFWSRPDPENIRFGLEGEGQDSQQTLPALWRRPWDRE